MKVLRILFVLITVFTILASLWYLPAARTGASTPHAVLGFVLDSETIGIMGATVHINKTDGSGDSLVSVSDELGRYYADIDGFPGGYAAGDILEVTAIYHDHISSDTVTVSLDPYDQLDIHFDFRAHVIDGYVWREVDGTYARYYDVVVTNEETGENKTIPTDDHGYYRSELSTFADGYSQGDFIYVEVDHYGFFGDNYTLVSSEPADRMNITLEDDQEPFYREELHEAPESVNLEQDFEIQAWVRDNHKLASVKLFMKKAGGMYTGYDMVLGNNNIWSQSTHLDIPVQTELGHLYYYINATDATGNYATLPSHNPKENPFRIDVIDNNPPTLSHTPITRVEAGEPSEIIATAYDNVAVHEVNLFYRVVEDPGFTRVMMTETGDPKTYGASIPAQYKLGILEYYLTCNDTSNNTVRLPESGEWTVYVNDTTAPKITHSKINSAYAHDPINITCRVFDTFLDTVWLNYTDVLGDDHNHTMANDTGTEDGYYFEIPGQDATRIFHYTIRANDASGNIAKVSHAFLVLDVSSPMIVHEPPEFLEFGQPVQIHAYAEDDVKLEFVNLSYLPVGGTEFISVEMVNTDVNGDDTHGNYSAEIQAQTALGHLSYTINATDGINNITWPSVSPPYIIQVLDTVPPEFSGLAYAADNPSGTGANVSVNVTDAHSVASVKLHYLNSTAESWEYVEMDREEQDSYVAAIPPHPLGQVKFYIWANDSSNNSATLPAATPKLNPFLVNFTDDSPPELELIIPDSVGVNRTAEVYLNVTDDTAVTSVQLHFKGTGDNAFRLLELSKTGHDSYMSTIPRQMSSGRAQIYASASDGINVNQTEVLEINVVNTPPEIQHTSPGTVPVDSIIAITAKVTDDLRVENVNLEWRYPEGPTTVQAMHPRAGNFYRTNLSFSEPATINYRIIAYDAETHTQCPETGYHELIVSDTEPPVIVHEPLQNLTTAEMPIFTATVTDDKAVASVTLRYRNSTSGEFVSEAMIPVSGTDDYAAILDRQPEGNFSYCIKATDGVNTARSPETGYHELSVQCPEGDRVPAVMFAILVILLVLAVVLVLMHLRRKHINDVAESGDDGIEENENA